NEETGLVRGYGDDYGLYGGFIDKRFRLFPHDQDTLFHIRDTSRPTTSSIFSFVDGSGDGGVVDGLVKLLSDPRAVQIYYQQFVDLINTVFNPTVMNPLIDRTLGGGIGNASQIA